MAKPRFLNDEAFKCLRVGEIDQFHRIIESRSLVDFSGADLRGTDFRNVDFRKITLRDAYLREADLRGCDLRQVDLEGASLHNAKIAGVYFSESLSPEEIQLSVQHGTRLRTVKQ